MKRLALTSLGLAVLGSTAAAGPGDGGWLGLDSEINDLASTLSPSQSGTSLTVLTRTGLGYSDDEGITGSSSGPDIFGFELNDIDIALTGGTGDFQYRVGFDLDSGSAQLEDAYAQWACGDYANVQLGRFKPRVLRSGWIDPENQLFIDRTALGSTYDRWDAGAVVFGQTEGLGWSLSAQNGATGEHASHLWVLGLWWDFGAGAGEFEGARGGNDELNATLGISLTNESGKTSGLSDNQSTMVEFNGNYGKFGFGAEWADVDKDDGGPVASDYGLGSFLPGEHPIMGDSNPYNITLSYLATPDVEVAVRREIWDDADGDDTNAWSLGASYYRSGNNAKLQAQFTSTDDSSHGDDGNYWQLGLTVGASR